MLRLIHDAQKEQQVDFQMTLDGVAREGARRMLALALDAEVAEYMEKVKEFRDDKGHALVVRNGKGKQRQITVGSGTFRLNVPRVNDKRVIDGEKQRFTSAILPPYMRRSPKVNEVLPVLYLRGLSTGDFSEALKSLLGEDAAGLSPSTICRLTAEWEKDYLAFQNRDLSDEEIVYIWADGVHFNVRLEDDRLCTLVVVGARSDGIKKVLAVEDGYRESTESWMSVLRNLKRRGLKAPALATGDGALGFWGALRSVWPKTKEQRCWVHKIANVLDKLPKRLQPKAKRALHGIMNAETKKEAEQGIKVFKVDYEAKHPKAVASLTKNQDALLTFYEFPAEHWNHIRTGNPIESAFATVRLRQRVTKGAGSRRKALLMAYKLLDMAENRWRKLRGYRLLPNVYAGEKCVDGIFPSKTTRIAA